VSELGVEWAGSELSINSSAAVDLTKLTVFSQKAISRVNVNGAATDFGQADNYVYFGNAPILNGRNIPLYEAAAGNAQVGVPQGDGGTAAAPPHGAASGGGNGGGNSPMPSPAPSEKPSDAFQNELDGHWGKEEIAYLIDKGLIIGNEGKLNLKDNVTRAEFTAMLLRAVGISEKPYENCFPDVGAGDWYAGCIQAAHDAGILDGSDGRAEPEKLVTREQAAKILIKTYEAAGGGTVSGNAPGFTDADKISDWAKEYVASAVNLGLVNGMGDGSFAPRAGALREQAMIMAYRLLSIGN
jgi:hypothetical protein